jgi:hypothetical protein
MIILYTVVSPGELKRIIDVQVSPGRSRLMGCGITDSLVEI